MTETPPQDRVNTENLRDYSQLRRSTTDRKIAGVAGGLARHLNIDPTIVRVAFVVLCLFGGAGFVLYGAAWLIVPEDGKAEATIATNASTRNALLIGAAVVAGLLLLGASWGGFGFPWPLAIVALVVFVIWMNRDKAMNTNNPPGQWSGSAPAAGGTATLPPVDASGNEPTTGYGLQPPGPPWMPPAQEAYQPPQPRPDRGPKLFWITIALVAIALGVLGLYDVSGAVADSDYPALALTVVGVMLVVGAWVGRAGGLIFLGIVAVIALAATSVVSPHFDGDRRIDVAPLSAAAVKDSYYVPAGQIYPDLSKVRDVESLDGRTLDVRANAGELIVILPDNVNTHVVGDISVAGDAEIPGQSEGGTDVHVEREVSAPDAGSPQLNLHLHLVIGHIEVRQS